MSEHTCVLFSAKPEQKVAVEESLSKIFDATSIEESEEGNGYNTEYLWYSLVISELDLAESLKVLDELTLQHPWLHFIIEYGVYYGKKKEGGVR